MPTSTGAQDRSRLAGRAVAGVALVAVAITAIGVPLGLFGTQSGGSDPEPSSAEAPAGTTAGDVPDPLALSTPSQGTQLPGTQPPGTAPSEGVVPESGTLPPLLPGAGDSNRPDRVRAPGSLAPDAGTTRFTAPRQPTAPAPRPKAPDGAAPPVSPPVGNPDPTEPSPTSGSRQPPSSPTPDKVATQPPAPPGGVAPPARTGQLAPAYISNTTYFGTALSSSDGSIAEALAANDGLFGKMAAVRQFDPTVPPEGAWSRRTGLNDRVLSTSFREPPAEILAGRHDARLSAYFREAPARKPIFWTYFHEPEPHIDRGEFTHAQYREAWRHVVRLAARAKKSNLYPTLVLTGWTTDPASKRNWRDYYPGDEYISVVAWDPYNSATSRPSSYREPAQLFAHVLRASEASGKPWGIAETGSMMVRGDDGRGRAAWLTKMGNYFDREGAAFVTYFQSTRDGDFKLTDKPSIQAWAQFVRRSSP